MQNETSSKNKSSNFLTVGIVIVIGIILLLAYCHKKSSAPKVYFGNLKDSAEVESPFQVEMKAENLVVEPADKGVAKGHGHFHIIIDSPLPATGEPVPMDSLHLHYGKGQTNATLDLSEGEHTLTLQFADGNHFPYDPQVTQVVHIRVTKRNTSSVIVDSTKQVDVETVNETHKMTTSHTNTKSTNATHLSKDTLPNTPPPIDPGHGGGMGAGSGGGIGGGMGSGH